MADHRLYYTSPSTTFPTSAPLGNGRLGASVMSSPAHETFMLNEITFWSGCKYTAGRDLEEHARDPKAELREAQRLLLAGDYDGATAISERYFQCKKNNFGSNLPVGKLDVTVVGHEDEASVSGFERELRFDDAVAETRYQLGGHSYTRKSFVSYPHQVLVATFETSNPEGLKLVVSLKGENDEFKTRGGDKQLGFDIHALEKLHSDGVSGVKGNGVVAVKSEQGDAEIEVKDGKMTVTAKKSVTLLLAMNTDFHNAEWETQAAKQISEASQQSLDALLKAHIDDYQPLYRRTSITLGPSPASATSLPTDQRRQRFNTSSFDDPGMFALYFHYARYLNIAGTRENAPLPMHLQGVWNDGEACNMGWSCDYHLDINIEMNYYATMSSALPETMRPLVEYIKGLADCGKDAAQKVYGCDGWVCHVYSNAWGYCDPGFAISYGLNVTGGLWLASFLIEMYEYSLDLSFLESTAYPVMKGAAEFFMSYMVEDPKTGWLLTGPSVSPENSFYVVGKDGKQGEHQIGLSPTIDVVLIRDLFAFCVHAAERLDVDADFAHRAQAAHDKLPPFQVTKLGQLQEWLHDFEEAQPYHRHLSPLIAMFRSAQITQRHTPELAEAVAVSLETRQKADDLEDIEFTMALFAMNYARLGNAAAAELKVGHLIGDLSFDNLLSYSKPGVAGAETNIFIIDGNFGGAAAVVEMLVRSVMLKTGGEVEVDLLPALPEAWAEGNVKGIKLKGGLEIDMAWSAGRLKSVSFKASSDGSMAVYYGSDEQKVTYKKDEVCTLGPSLKVQS